MKKLELFIIFSILLVTYSGLLAAVGTNDTWDDGQLHGWQGNTAWTEVAVVNTGGNPGGYLQSVCTLEGNPTVSPGAITEEDRYTGNYTSAKINRVAFDLNVVSGQFEWIWLRIRYHDFTYNGWHYPLSIKKMPIGGWVHYEVSFDPNWTDAQAMAAGWEQENRSSSFQETMSDVYTLEIRTYSRDVNSTRLGIDNFSIFSSASHGTILYKGTVSDIQERFTGWWYSNEEQGTGLALEIQGKRLFAAWFMFDEDGRTTWYTTGGNMTDDSTYQGDVLGWEGWPWGQLYRQPVWEKVGTVTLVLNQGAEDSLSYNGTINNVTDSKTFTSFMADFAPGTMDSRDLTGWWYDPSYEGMGFFIDAQGGKMAMVWYNYRNDGSSRWWTSSGSFADGATTYSGSLDGWENGQCFACPYRQPERLDGAGGNITIDFIDSTHAVLDVNGTALHIERFIIPAP